MNLNLNSVHLFVTESKQALNIGTWAPFVQLLNTGHMIQPTAMCGAMHYSLLRPKINTILGLNMKINVKCKITKIPLVFCDE